MKTTHTIFGKSEYAVVNIDLEAVKQVLQNNPKWGAEVLERSGEYPMVVKRLRKWKRVWYASGIVESGVDSFVSIEIIGKRSFLSYHIRKEDEHSVRVIPLGYVPKRIKVFTTIVLGLFYILPALLAPLIWKSYELTILRSSKLYLDSFCRYLQDHSES